MKWKQYLSVGVAVLTCPFHLPLLAAVLAGTALGGWLGQYTLTVTLGMTGIFMLAVLCSFRAFTPMHRHEDDSASVGARDVNHAEDRRTGV